MKKYILVGAIALLAFGFTSIVLALTTTTTYSLNYATGRIESTKAEHLNQNREFISDIYSAVKAKDNVWSEAINPNEFARIGFEQKLGKSNDITIYARATSPARIEVYTENGANAIATFKGIESEGWHKVFLIGLAEGESSATFDLKILDSPVEFDYIVDPAPNLDVNVTHIDGWLDSQAMPSFSYAVDGNLTIDFNIASDTNFGYHYADLNYSTSKTQGTGTTIIDGLKVDGNRCQTNFVGDWNNQANSDVNLVGYWKFDSQEDDRNTTHAFDYSGNNNHGQYYNGADNNAGGRWDTNAGFFDGVNDYAGIGAVSVGTVWTVEFWFKPKTLAGYKTVLGDTISSDIEILNKLTIYENGSPLQGNTILATGIWQHIAIAASGSNYAIYYNGVPDGTPAQTRSWVFRYIGSNSGTIEFFNGAIEELKIYNRALTAAEISLDYNLSARNFRSCKWDWNISGIADANYYALINTKDNAGNSNFDASDNSFMVENNSPVTVDNDFNRAWQNTDANIQIKCTDTGGSGCKNLHYSLDDVNYQRGWGTDQNIGITLNTDLNHKIFYWSSDKADHNESAKLIYLAIDKTAPTISISSPSNGSSQTSTSVALQYSGTDATSGIAKYWVKADSGEWVYNSTNTTYTFSSQSVASHTYYVKAQDNADNNSSEASVSVTITSSTTTTTTDTSGEGGGYSGSPGGPGGVPIGLGKAKEEERCVEEGFLCRAGRKCCSGLKCILDRCRKQRCESNAECSAWEKCLGGECNEILGLEIIRADARIKLGEALDFSFVAKNLGNEAIGAKALYWLERNGEKLLESDENAFLEAGQEKEMSGKLQTSGQTMGEYLLVVELLGDGLNRTVTRAVEVAETAPLDIDLSISRLSSEIIEQPVKLFYTIGSNWDESVKVRVNSVILKGNEIVWQESRNLSVKVAMKLEQEIPLLEPGEYRWVVTVSSGKEMESIERTIKVKAKESQQPTSTALLVQSIFGQLPEFLKPLQEFALNTLNAFMQTTFGQWLYGLLRQLAGHLRL